MSEKVANIDLAGLSSKELTDLSIRCLATRKALNEKKRVAGKAKSQKRKADRMKYLEAELAKLKG